MSGAGGEPAPDDLYSVRSGVRRPATWVAPTCAHCCPWRSGTSAGSAARLG